ncbi:MAG: PQQ-binding-like beta-propeller repeat protein [Chthoniobacter sp.]|uniref:outer membrane protein assembly factor BamB family protein n=1 Tax=Chthoniobacter sp. TaxID=2510640 RepID=UPI0032A8B9AD
MRARSPFSVYAVALAMFLPGAGRAGESWPQFRGLAAGHTEVKDLPLTWSETEHVKWKTPLPGVGWSSPVVANGQIWMTTALEDGVSLHALCCDLATGKLLIDVEVFKNAVVPPKHARNSYASPTPIIDGDRVYVNFGSMGTACLSAKDGHKLWENREYQVDHQNGPGGSPALFQDKLLIAFDGRDQQFEIALNKMTGQLAWKTERSGIAKLQAKPEDMRKSYPTPVIFQIDGQAQTLSTGAERLYSYDPNTGRELWSVDYPGFSNVPLPVTDGRMLFVCTGFMKPEIWGIRVGGAQGDATASHVIWRQHTAVPDQSTPVVIGSRLYMVSSSGIASCLNTATGETLWKERISSDIAASPLAAEGRIYFCDARGQTTVIAPADHFQVLAQNPLADGCMASPAVVGKALILRTKTSLYRIEN